MQKHSSLATFGIYWTSSPTNMWNTSGIPVGYLITMRTFGTWLHGDERGCIDRFRNGYKTPYKPPASKLKRYVEGQMKQSPVALNPRQRKAVRQSMVETCEKRNWNLIAQNVRSNHVHAVVMIGDLSSSIALNALKANATRVMRERGLWPSSQSPWAAKGSRRPLWTDQEVAFAADYVQYEQGPPLPEED